MKLTSFEEKALRGKYGKGLGLAARITVNLGEFFNAPYTVGITSAHISGVSLKTGGKALERVLDIIAEGNNTTRVPAFLNPAGFDLRRYESMGVPEDFQRRQQEIIEKFVSLGVLPTLTCTPYLNGLVPKKGDILAWAESSAVTFANSYIGARTNRESGISALAAALTGRTPYYGLLIRENRRPDLIVRTEEELTVEGDRLYMLGLLVGKRRPTSIPYMTGIEPKNVTEYKGLGAGMAASGNISLYHVEGETPEAGWAKRTIDEGREAVPSLTITRDMMEELFERNRPKTLPSLMAVGCPHASVEEIIEIDRSLKGEVKDTDFWIFTSRQTEILAARMGLVGSLKRKGVEIFADTCMVVMPTEQLDYDLIATNSSKALHYLPRMGNVPTVFMPLDEMIKVAREGAI